MIQYVLEIELKSETVFGSGHSVPGMVDQEVLYDDYGFPYMKGKTVKGKLKEEVAHVLWCLSKGKRGMADPLIDDLFGAPASDTAAVLRFSDLCMDETVRQMFVKKIQAGDFEAKDILNASTEIRSFTGIDYEKGVAKKGSLRRVRVIRKGLYFYSHIFPGRDLSSLEEDIMGIAAASLKHLGTMETRGMGYVSCRLMKGQENLTDQSMIRPREGILDGISVL